MHRGVFLTGFGPRCPPQQPSRRVCSHAISLKNYANRNLQVPVENVRCMHRSCNFASINNLLLCFRYQVSRVHERTPENQEREVGQVPISERMG